MSERLRIVLADDTVEYRLLLRVVLEQDGRFEIVGDAEDGVQAVAACVAARPAAILLDLAMPELDGLEAIPMICERSPETAIVVLSGFARGTVDRQALALGADAYVEKGEAFSTVADTLVEVVSRRAGAVA